MKNKALWKTIIQMAVSILTAALTALGTTSCLRLMKIKRGLTSTTEPALLPFQSSLVFNCVTNRFGFSYCVTIHFITGCIVTKPHLRINDTNRGNNIILFHCVDVVFSVPLVNNSDPNLTLIVYSTPASHSHLSSGFSINRSS